MKKLVLIFAVVLFTVGFASNVSAQNPLLTVNNNAGGEIMAPLTIISDGSLEFGRLAVEAAAGGTVVLTPAASTTVSRTGGVSLIAGTTRTAAKYNVGGEIGYSYTITVPADGVVNIESGSNAMAISTFTFLSLNPTPTGGTLSASGTDIFYVGATLVVPAAQPAGQYTGTFDVSVNYN